MTPSSPYNYEVQVVEFFDFTSGDLILKDLFKLTAYMYLEVSMMHKLH